MVANNRNLIQTSLGGKAIGRRSWEEYLTGLKEELHEPGPQVLEAELSATEPELSITRTHTTYTCVSVSESVS